MAVTANQIMRVEDGNRKSYPVATTIHIYEGTMVFLTTTGYATDIVASGANVFAGIAVSEVDNSGGGNGAVEVECIYTGDFVLTGSGFSQGTLGDRIYASDNYTISASSSSTSFVGRCSRYISSTSLVVDINDRIDPSNNAVAAVADDTSLILGDGSDFQLLWSTGDASNHAAVVAIGDTSQQIHITDVGAMATDWNISAGTHPELLVHSNTTPATDYLGIGLHDGTTAYLNVAGGTTLSIKIAGTIYAGVTASGVSADGLVELTATNGITADGVRLKDGRVWETVTVASTTSATPAITAANMAGGVVVATTQSTSTVTLDTGTALDTAFTSIVGTGSGFCWSIVNSNSGTMTITANTTGNNLTGLNTLATNVVGRFFTYRTGTNAWATIRIA
jgi:hypothetical protein